MEAWNKFTTSASATLGSLSQNAAPMGEKLTRGFGNLVSLCACARCRMLSWPTDDACFCVSPFVEPAS